MPNEFAQIFVDAVLPAAGSLLAGALTAAALKLRKKYSIEVTTQTRDALHDALMRALKTLLTERILAGHKLDVNAEEAMAITNEAAHLASDSNPEQYRALNASIPVLSRVALSKLPTAVAEVKATLQAPVAIAVAGKSAS